MGSLISELKRYVKTSVDFDSDNRLWFKAIHEIYFEHDFKEEAIDNLNDFLSATMDEVRLRCANKYAKEVLKITDIDDFNFFSIGVLKREMAGDISYFKQRDHSAHSLYNYLLGWYLFENINIIKDTFAHHCALRGIDNDHYFMTFFELWPIVSLLHDIGYIFEGSLGPLDTSVQNELIMKGVELANDYFKHTCWVEIGFSPINEQQIIKLMTGVNEPEIMSRSLLELSDSLRFLDNLELLRQEINDEMGLSRNLVGKTDYIKTRYGLPGDAFTIWKRHFDYYGNKLLYKRIISLEKSYEYLLNEGLDPGGERVLDHGICSGLLLLISSTFYFRMHVALKNFSPENKYQKTLRNNFLTRTSGYSALHWWRGIVWATAATAIHNIQQVKFKNIPHKKLKIDEDPLAYLGIIVDILQVWDRTNIRKGAVLKGDLPIQGIDIDLFKTKTGKVFINYKNNETSKAIKTDLNNALTGWEKLLIIKPD